ncbi:MULTISPECIES: aminotransferase class I/II-fold pyridoxal phosphate-dependent enzyme [Oceanobacillus]|uniref:Aminotransferase class I/II-fold pyridoxal phosphate-dependent enzyme n=1 Tax=Oceanobacillus aidingensis TaxID=645964 RepID=A0ABV9JT80_9BACI|nr:aminotransferase class I/II-fold pyridoxal phosphate-dependent enzyme [Oceanobacillus oncorhynchi]MDM8101445.1 aminotransferase class I/II-fold pyridoxal phosphate-dependent enzyme [Oceanobacillus oncorhynchi]
MEQQRMPLAEHLQAFAKRNPISFHVPGHKHGEVFTPAYHNNFQQMLRWDVTEITGMDDLHAPAGIIADAESLAAAFFQTQHTFFLVGGSTAGNLAMILAACKQEDKILIQRNCHKSVMNGVELAGAQPVFLAPEWEEQVSRFTSPSYETIASAIEQHPDAKAIVLTYPDYFGQTYQLKAMIDKAHQYNIPVLVDEAHGVHFALGDPFPASAIELGADAVVHSAHKMAPAMTMASYLHLGTSRINPSQIAHYLQIVQSSSPSYILMASLDIARHFLAHFLKEDRIKTIKSVEQVKQLFSAFSFWEFMPSDDSLKLTFHVKHSFSTKSVVNLLEKAGIFPELATDEQILFVHGLAPMEEIDTLEKRLKTIGHPLKKSANRATIERTNLFPEKVQELDLSYQEMNNYPTYLVSMRESIGEIAAEAVIPYPPGIPLLLKGERIQEMHIAHLEKLVEQGVRIQHRDEGIRIYRNKGER